MEDDTAGSAATVTPATGGGRSARRNKRDRSERDTGSVVVVSGGSKNHDTEGSILDSTTTTTVPGGVASTSGSLVASVDSVDNGNDAIGNGVNDDDVVDGNGDGGKVKCPKKVAGGRRGQKMKQEVVETSDQKEINHKVKISGRSNSSDSNGDLGEMGSREVNVEITMNGDIDELSTKHRLQATMNGVATSRCGDLEHDQQQQQQKDTGTEGQNNEETILGNAAAATLQAEESNLPSPSSLDENEPSPKTPSSTTTSPPLLPTTNTKGSKYCAHESCTKYRQTGCYGYCLTHKLIADPNMHAIKRNIAEHNSDMKKRTLNKSNLCKWPSCTKYIQSNCNGYCLTHVKYANYEEGDVYDVTKVRVRIGSRLQNGFCRAILPLELRRQWGFDVAGGGGGGGGGMNSGEGICGETSSPMGETPGKIMGGVGGDANVSDENVEANNTSGDDVGDSSNQFQNDRMLAISPEISNGTPKRRTIDGSDSSQAISLGGANDDMEMETADDIIFGLTPEGGFRSQRTYVPPEHIAQLSLTPNLKEGGRSICKMIGCGKLDQSNNDGFCRMHFHMFEVREKSDDDWTCGCGLLMAGSQKRCGVCCRVSFPFWVDNVSS